MVQKDKQPEWFPEAKVRPDPSRRFLARAARPSVPMRRALSEETLKPQRSRARLFCVFRV